ncbi:MAG: cadmium-translocating P-type ATPase [Ruminococcus sp.]|nr:cadmium-translocating P-type ATPase [Ruminococcus sp.]
MKRKQKKVLVRIIVSAVLLVFAKIFCPDEWWAAFVYAVPYLVIGYDVIFKAVRNIANGQVFDENFLMVIATVGAFATGEYTEAAAVMLFYQTGELFQSVAVGRSRKSISELMDIRPDYANIERDGKLEQVDPDEIAVGDEIIIKPGEKIPLDGIVLEGRSAADTSALTGESLPREIDAGDDVVSGCINLTGVLRVRVTKPFGESTVSKILELTENAASQKAKTENFITRFARYYTPAVVFAALALAVIPPLIAGGGWMTWIHRALIFLVISCPCALVISVPLSFFGGIGGAGRQGILVKGGSCFESLAKTDTVVFDKTGTLTKGVFNVTAVHPESISEQRLTELAAYAESSSTHPIAAALRDACNTQIDRSRITSCEEIAGRGVRAVIDGEEVCAGNGKLMDDIGVSWHPCHHVGTTVHIAVNGVYAGHLVISDEVKETSAAAIAELGRIGVKKTVMLTGDADAVGKDAAKKLGIGEVYTELLPADKVEKVEGLLNAEQGGVLAFVGDGINDAPVLARADIGIAMGAMGSDAAIEAADVVLMDDDPAKLAKAILTARRTLRIVYENIVFALGVKALVLILGALGFASMWAAVFADVGVSVIAILNAMRALKVKN